jgi:hypothetical protein
MAKLKSIADYADSTARLGPQTKLNSLRYLAILCVSAVFLGPSWTLKKHCLRNILIDHSLLSVWDSPRKTAETQRTPR